MRHLQIFLLASTAALAACGTETAPATSGGDGSGPVTATPSPTPTPSAPPTATPNPTPSPTPPPSSGMTGDPTQDAMLEVMLAEHNAARAEVGVPALILDNDLNQQALAYAEEMARTGLFQHSQGSDRPNQGENLWAGTAGAFPYERMVGAFIDEKQYYIHAAFPNVSTTGNWQDVGHYTQIVWRNTTHLGCGIATGLGRDWLVCRYSPPGNWIGQFAY